MAERDRDAKPEVKEEKKKVKRGKKPHKNKPTSKKYLHYKVEGQKIVSAPYCPRCGAGVFLAIREDRLHCGRCSYTSFDKEEVQRAKKK